MQQFLRADGRPLRGDTLQQLAQLFQNILAGDPFALEDSLRLRHLLPGGDISATGCGGLLHGKRVPALFHGKRAFRPRSVNWRARHSFRRSRQERRCRRCSGAALTGRSCGAFWRSRGERFLEGPHQLSGGMLQRVMIGLAICMQPSLIIADEPTTAIDSISQYAIMQEFLRIKQRGEVSMIFISHDLGVLSLIADRLIVMHDGKAVESGTAQEIFDNATDTYTRHLIKQHRAVMHRFLDALHAPVPGRISA